MIRPYRVIHGAFTRYENNFSNASESASCEFFLKSPDPDTTIGTSYSLEDIGYTPVMISNATIEKSSFPSAYNAIYGYRTDCTHKVKIGKSDKVVYVSYRYAFEKDPITKEYHLMYLVCNKPSSNNRISENRIVAYLSPKFVYDTKTIWYSGFKTHVLGYFLQFSELTTIVCNNLDDCIVKKPIPESINYRDDIQKFLKSDVALEYAERFIR